MLWAAEPGGAGNFTSPITWVNYGVLGLIFLGWATGWLHSKAEVERLETEINHLRADLVKLRDDQVVEVARIRAEREGFTSQVRAERDKAQAKVDSMADVYQTALLPSLNKFLSTIEVLLPLLQRVAERNGGNNSR